MLDKISPSTACLSSYQLQIVNIKKRWKKKRYTKQNTVADKKKKKLQECIHQIYLIRSNL